MGQSIGSIPASTEVALDTELDAVALTAVPIGGMIPYAGSTAPNSNFLVADGRLVSTTTYATLFSRVGHAYNGNVDPGGGNFRIPDKRGRNSVGATSFGTDGTNGVVAISSGDNGRLFGVGRGAGGGEKAHTMLSTEVYLRGHGHAHSLNIGGGVTVNTGGAHTHVNGDGGGFPAGLGASGQQGSSGYWVGGSAVSNTGTPGSDHNHSTSHNLSVGGSVTNSSDVAPSAAMPLADPYQADYWIVRVL